MLLPNTPLQRTRVAPLILKDTISSVSDHERIRDCSISVANWQDRRAPYGAVVMEDVRTQGNPD